MKKISVFCGLIAGLYGAANDAMAANIQPFAQEETCPSFSNMTMDEVKITEKKINTKLKNRKPVSETEIKWLKNARRSGYLNDAKWLWFQNELNKDAKRKEKSKEQSVKQWMNKMCVLQAQIAELMKNPPVKLPVVDTTPIFQGNYQLPFRRIVEDEAASGTATVLMPVVLDNQQIVPELEQQQEAGIIPAEVQINEQPERNVEEDIEDQNTNEQIEIIRYFATDKLLAAVRKANTIRGLDRNDWTPFFERICDDNFGTTDDDKAYLITGLNRLLCLLGERWHRFSGTARFWVNENLENNYENLVVGDVFRNFCMDDEEFRRNHNNLEHTNCLLNIFNALLYKRAIQPYL